MTTSTLYQLLSGIAERLDGRYPGITASLQFDVGESGGSRGYCLLIERGVCRVETGACAASATATIRAQEQDAIDLLTGKLEAEYALHAGKLEATGNLRVLALLEAALSPDEGPFRCLLSGSYPSEVLQDVLLPRADWHPYPTIEDRAGWEALPASVRKALLDGGKRALEEEWAQTLAVRYLDYARNGNRSRYQGAAFRRRGKLSSLVLAECVENQGRCLDEIANGIWMICEESSWCVPAHISVQQVGVGLPDTSEPIVDLFAAETSALLAWVDYLVGSRLDGVSSLIRPRVQREIDARILTPCLERDDFWWMGFTPRRVNNWNPWINSNWLTSALLMEADAERRLAAVAKSMRSIDRFLGPYPRDGGCDEGPGYWGRAGASLLDCLELLYSATGGQIDLYGDPLVQDIGRFIYRVQIGGRYFVNFADASAIVAPPPAVVFRYGQRIGDPDLVTLGAWLATDQDLLHPSVDRRGSLGRALPAMFGLDEMLAVEPRQPLPRDVWLNEIEVMVARDQAGSSAGLYLAAKGGHNAESHNHNDVGNWVAYVDGRPLLVDAGVETYTRKTFSAQRYEIWTMQSAYHSLLPTIDGVMQAPGRTFAAREADHQADDRSARFTVDIAGAYPPEVGLKHWRREITLRRGQEVEIVDHYELEQEVGEITLSLLTPCEVALEAPGQVVLSAVSLPDGRYTGRGSMSYDVERFALTTKEVVIGDERLGGVWGERLTRLVFTARDPAQQDVWAFHIYPVGWGRAESVTMG